MVLQDVGKRNRGREQEIKREGNMKGESRGENPKKDRE